MRTAFDEQLAQLSGELTELGGLCEEAIAVAAKALLEGGNAAGRARALEEETDRKERDIEALCFRLLLRQQPVAGDLRLISTALKMITDLERIGDQAVDIAELATYIPGGAGKVCPELGDMAREVIGMVTDGAESFARRDPAMAEEVIARDDRVDSLFAAIKREVATRLACGTDGEAAVDLLMAAKYLERIGDHAVNLAEWAVFAVTGVHKGEAEL